MGETSVLMSGSFYAVFLVRETLCGGKESLSIAIVGEDEKIALSIYLRRTADNTLVITLKVSTMATDNHCSSCGIMQTCIIKRQG